LFFLLSCSQTLQIENDDQDKSKLNIEDLTVPLNFEWKTKNESHFTVIHRGEEAQVKIEFRDPEHNILSTLLLQKDREVDHTLTLSSHIEFVKIIYNDKDMGNFPLPLQDIELPAYMAPEVAYKVTSAPSCQTCDINLTGNNNYTLNTAGQTACIQSGVTYTGGLTFGTNNITLEVCGTMKNNSYLNFNGNNSEFVIADGGVYQPSGSINIGPTFDLSNYGTVNTSNAISVNSYLYNAGTINFNNTNAHLNVNSGATLENTCAGAINVYGQGDYINNSGASTLNYGVIRTGTGDWYQNSNTVLDMGKNARIITSDLYLNSGQNLTGSAEGCALFTYKQSLTNNDNYVEDPNIVDIFKQNGSAAQVCFPSAIADICSAEASSSSSASSSSATSSSSASSSSSSNSCIDNDLDSCCDHLDIDSTDVNVCSYAYLPSENQYGTYAFEDRWPNKGDYDFNDLILNYNYRYSLNADNKITSIKYNFKLRAIGATYDNGFALKIDASPSEVSNHTGVVLYKDKVNLDSKNLEANQSKTVLFITDRLHTRMDQYPGQFVNTVANGNTADPVDIEMETAFNTPQDYPISISPMLMINQIRGREVSLIDDTPSDLVDTTYYQNGHDNSIDHVSYYQTDTFLPWALEFLIEWKYPKENRSISNSWSRFNSWAESGGSLDQDWFLEVDSNFVENKIYP
jgi:LruC domain-containing protein